MLKPFLIKCCVFLDYITQPFIALSSNIYLCGKNQEKTIEHRPRRRNLALTDMLVLICLIKFIKVHKRLILMWLLWNKLQCYEVEHHVNRNGGQYDETGIGNRAALQRVQREGLVSIVDALQTGVRGTRKIKSRNLSLTKSLKTPLEVRNF